MLVYIFYKLLCWRFNNTANSVHFCISFILVSILITTISVIRSKLSIFIDRCIATEKLGIWYHHRCNIESTLQTNLTDFTNSSHTCSWHFNYDSISIYFLINKSRLIISFIAADIGRTWCLLLGRVIFSVYRWFQRVILSFSIVTIDILLKRAYNL
jgi:hypothetical protein